MMDGTANEAAWQRAVGEALHVAPAALRAPGPGEILIRNVAIALNPLDWILQEYAILPWLTYPAILGSDVAGEVAAIGSGVERFRIGDRVLGQAVGTTVNQTAQGAFQQHTIVLEHMAAPIPDKMRFADAVVLPLGIGTAASGLYGATQLGLAAPSLPAVARDDVVLVWGASSSVGCNAVQLAVASGYTCIATASARNADLVKALGASIVLDHASPSIVDDVVTAVAGRRLAGTLHATGDMATTFAAVSRCEGVRAVAATLPPAVEPPAGVTATHIHGTLLKDDGIGQMIYGDFLPRALKQDAYIAAPPARIVGHGLEALQEALTMLKAGVSAAKIVVSVAD